MSTKLFIGVKQVCSFNIACMELLRSTANEDLNGLQAPHQCLFMHWIIKAYSLWSPKLSYKYCTYRNQ